MIVAFSGWRGWTDAPFIHAQIDKILAQQTMFGQPAVPLHIRVGDASGVDAIVRAWVFGIDAAVVTVYEANWDLEGKSAGPHRNRRMLLGEEVFDPAFGKPADLLVAFPQPNKPYGYKSAGTWNCIGQAHFRGIEVHIPAYRPSAEALRENADPLLPFAVAGER